MYEEATGREAVISQQDVDLFNHSIEPLVRYGKLGAMLAQFPPSFKNDSYGQPILNAVIKTFGQYRLAVELRHRSWSDDELAEVVAGDVINVLSFGPQELTEVGDT